MAHVTQEWRLEKPVVVSRGGIVVAQYRAAAEVGAAMLRAGGNAVDAAVATAFALAALEPWNSGLGGIGYTLGQRPGAAARRPRGPLSVAAPGGVGGYGYALERFGSLPFARVIEPAIALAEAGLPV